MKTRTIKKMIESEITCDDETCNGCKHLTDKTGTPKCSLFGEVLDSYPAVDGTVFYRLDNCIDAEVK